MNSNQIIYPLGLRTHGSSPMMHRISCVRTHVAEFDRVPVSLFIISTSMSTDTRFTAAMCENRTHDPLASEDIVRIAWYMVYHKSSQTSEVNEKIKLKMTKKYSTSSQQIKINIQIIETSLRFCN